MDEKLILSIIGAIVSGMVGVSFWVIKGWLTKISNDISTKVSFTTCTLKEQELKGALTHEKEMRETMDTVFGEAVKELKNTIKEDFIPEVRAYREENSKLLDRLKSLEDAIERNGNGRNK